MTTPDFTPAADTTPAERERARRVVEAYLRGINQGGHPPVPPDEIADLYRLALYRIQNDPCAHPPPEDPEVLAEKACRAQFYPPAIEKQCGARISDQPPCILPLGHAGMHRDETGNYWGAVTRFISTYPEPQNGVTE